MDAIRGQKRNLSEKIETTVKASIHNRFDIEVVDSRTGKIKQKVQAENVICTNLWTHYFGAASKYSFAAYVQFGSGTGTPSSSDTTLFTYLGNKGLTHVSFNFDAKNKVANNVFKATILENEYVGSTLSEVGVSYTSQGSISTHALLKDQNGNAISIAKTNTDIINIYSTIFLHFVNTEHFSMLSLETSGTDTYYEQLLCRLCGYIANYNYSCLTTSFRFADNYRNTLGPSKGTDHGASLNYDSTKKTLSIATTRVEAASDNNLKNVTGILLFASNTSTDYHGIYVEIDDSWYPGTDISGEAIGTGDGTIKDYCTKFGYAVSPKIYINGVETSDYIMDTNLPLFESTAIGALSNALVTSRSLFRPITLAEDGTELYSVFFSSVNHDCSTKLDTVYKNLFNNSAKIEKMIFGTSGTYVIGLSVSNDGISWTDITTIDKATLSGYGIIIIPENLQSYKYFKILQSKATMNEYYYNGVNFWFGINKTINNIHFNTPPASGAVITADYTTKTIAKDADHVFDFSLTIQLGEHTT